MSISATARWILLALAGLAIAIGVAIAAANLTSRQIGIANESVSAGDSLAPALQVPGPGKPRQSGDHGGPDEAAPTTIPVPPPTPEEPGLEESSPSSGGSTGDDHGHGPDGDD